MVRSSLYNNRTDITQVNSKWVFLLFIRRKKEKQEEERVDVMMNEGVQWKDGYLKGFQHRHHFYLGTEKRKKRRARADDEVHFGRYAERRYLK